MQPTPAPPLPKENGTERFLREFDSYILDRFIIIIIFQKLLNAKL